MLRGALRLDVLALAQADGSIPTWRLDDRGERNKWGRLATASGTGWSVTLK